MLVADNTVPRDWCGNKERAERNEESVVAQFCTISWTE